MARGYTLDQATQMHYSSLGSHGPLASRSNSGGNLRSDDGRSRFSEVTGSQFDGDRGEYRGRDRERERDRDREMRRSSSREYRSRDARSESGRSLGERGRMSSGRSDAGMSRSSRDVRNRDRDYRDRSNGNNNSFRNADVYSVASSHEVESYYDGRDPYQRDPYSRPLPPPPAAAPAPAAARNADEQAMQVALLISQQEAEFGINMYDSLTPADQPEIDSLVASGYTTDDAIQMLFDRRYRSRPNNYGAGRANGSSVYGGGMQRMNSQPINQAFSRSGSNGSDFYGRQISPPSQPQYEYPRTYAVSLP